MAITFVAVAGLCVVPTSAVAQILGPLLPDKTFELGGSYKRTHRNYEGTGTNEGNENSKNYWDGSVFFRYGTNGWVTLSGEAMLGDVKTITESEGDNRYYTFGMGVQARIYRWSDYTLTAGFHYNDNLTFSQNGETCDVRFGSITGLVQIEKPFNVYQQRLILWGGPSYDYGIYDQYANKGCDESEWRSVNNLGLALGVDMVFYDHLRADVHVVYAEFVQPRFTLSWLF